MLALAEEEINCRQRSAGRSLIHWLDLARGTENFAKIAALRMRFQAELTDQLPRTIIHIPRSLSDRLGIPRAQKLRPRLIHLWLASDTMARLLILLATATPHPVRAESLFVYGFQLLIDDFT